MAILISIERRLMTKCGYKFRDGKQCEEEALPNANYCILHTELPIDEKSEEFKEIEKLKEKKVKEKTKKGDFNFEGVKLVNVDFSKKEIKEEVNFTNASIKKDVSFDLAKVKKTVWFIGVKIGGNISFREVVLDRDVTFSKAEINGHVSFGLARVNDGVYFESAKIDGDVTFMDAKIDLVVNLNGAKIKGSLNFMNAEIKGVALFEGLEIGWNASFYRTQFSRRAFFEFGQIGGRLTFENAKINNPEDQETAYRKAKKIYEDLGDRARADYYFYHEMAARRKQKKHFFNFLEFIFIQCIFGYGTRWLHVLITWFVVVLACAIIFWKFNGVVNADTLETASCFWQNIYFSIVTATTLGYGDYQPKLGIFQILASAEAIFGTFMWAAFIVIFARKYMR